MRFRLVSLVLILAAVAAPLAAQTRLNINWRALTVPVTFATLPGSPFTGQIAFITDGSAGCTAGSGTSHCLLEWNGASWDVYGGGASSYDFSAGWTTGISNMVSGGILYGSSTTVVKSSALLAAGAPVLGGGAGTAPATGGLVPTTYGGTGLNTGTQGAIPCWTTTSLGSSAMLASNLLLSGSIVTGGGAALCPSTISAVSLSSSAIFPVNSATSFGLTGNDNTSNAAIGTTSVKGGGITSGSGSSQRAGNVQILGGTDAGTNAASQGGWVAVDAGAATAGGLQGGVMVTDAYLKGATVTLWNLQCPTSVSETTADCGASPTNLIGVAENVGSATVKLAILGDSPINASAAVTVGHTVCAGTTAGKVTDSGGIGTCSSSEITVGTVKAVAGVRTLPDGTSVTLSTTLPLINRFNRSSGSGGSTNTFNTRFPIGVCQGVCTTAGTAGVSTAGSTISTGTAVTPYAVQGSSTKPPRGLAQFTIPGVLGTGTANIWETVVPVTYGVPNSSITVNGTSFCPAGSTAAAVTWFITYADSSSTAQPTFFSTGYPVTTSVPAGTGPANPVSWTVTITPNSSSSPTVTAGDSFFLALDLSADASGCTPVLTSLAAN